MGLFRVIGRSVGSILKTGTSLVNTTIRGKQRQVTSTARLATQATVFATSVLGLGTSLIRKASRGLNKSNSKAHTKSSPNSSSKGSKSNYQDEKVKNVEKPPKKTRKEKKIERAKAKQRREKEKLEEVERNYQEVLARNSDEYIVSLDEERAKERAKYTYDNPMNIPTGFYEVITDLKENWGVQIMNIHTDGVFYNGRGVEITLFPNMSKLEWEKYLHGTLKGKHELEYSPEEREALIRKHRLDRTKHIKKQQKIEIRPSGIYNEFGDNYFDICKNRSDILSRVSIDYGKNYLPLINHLFNCQETLERKGFF